MDELSRLCDIVRTASQQELMPRFNQVSYEFKDDGSVLTEADLAMQQHLQDELQRYWPDYVFLGEEMPASEQQAMLSQHAKGVWVVDPLDGTSNFSLGIPIFSVSVALLKKNKIVMGVVYDPVRDECFSAKQGKGAYLNGKPLSLAAVSNTATAVIGMVDLKRLPVALAQKLVAAPPYKSQRSIGTVALDWCWVAADRVQLYLHGRQNLWDYAAGNLVLQEAGGSSSTLEGEPVFNGSLTPRSAVGAINRHLFESWLALLQS